MTTTQRATLIDLLDTCRSIANEFGAREVASDLDETRKRLELQPDVSAGTTGRSWRETLGAGRAR